MGAESGVQGAGHTLGGRSPTLAVDPGLFSRDGAVRADCWCQPRSVFLSPTFLIKQAGDGEGRTLGSQEQGL